MRKLIATAVFALALGAATASAAEVYVGFGPRFGPPPPPRRVMVVRPGPRHVWVPGYYRWNRGRYLWVNGYWTIPPRPHAVWAPGYWAPRRTGYVWISGYWR